jgi:hypothetical protein
MTIKQTMTIGVMAFGLLFAGCAESGMEANQDSAQIPAGTQLHVRVNQSSSGSPYKAGDEFHGTLERALEVNGQTIAPVGTIVRGEYTNDLGSRGTDAGMSGVAGDSGDPTIASRDKADREGDTASGTEADRRAGETGTMTGERSDHDQIGVELAKLVINGEEYDIDTEPVPIHGAGSYSSGPEGVGTESGTASSAMSPTMVFTLSENVELPTNTAKSE